MEKIYLVSDIHASNKVFEVLGDKISVKSPLYILGDLLDDKKSEADQYKQMINNIYHGIANGSIRLFTGNHDVLTYRLISKPSMSNSKEAKLAFENIASVYSSYVYDTIKKLFGTQFFDYLYELQSECINAGTQGGDVDYLSLVEQYYTNVEKGTYLMDSNELECYEQAIYISRKSRMYEVIEWKDKKYLLSHTGSKIDPWSTEIYSSYFQPNEEIDYYIVGHISHDSIERLTNVPLSEYNFNNDLENVSGIYVYNKELKLINIDNNTKSNIVTLV